MRIPYFAAPVVLGRDEVLLYDDSYRQPVRHFRMSADAKQLLTRVQRGQPIAIDDAVQSFLAGLPFVSFYEASIDTPDSIIVDCDLGSPAVWANLVYDLECARGGRPLLLSLRQERVAFAGNELPRFEPWDRRTFIVVARALMQRLRTSRMLVCGHEAGAKLFDLLSADDTWMIETGFAEWAAIPDAPPALRTRVLDEVLFREHAFPWDNVAEAIAMGEAIAHSRNFVWSETLAATLARQFPSAMTRFVAPSIDVALFSVAHRERGGPLRILAGTGAHTAGPNGIGFLALHPLVEAVAAIDDCTLTIITGDEPRLRSLLPLDHPRIVVAGRTRRGDLPAIYAAHDVYYRLQDDGSIPLSCIEAMAAGMAVVLNEKTAPTFCELRGGTNVVHLPHGDTAALTEALRRLAADREAVARIGDAAVQTARSHCDVARALRQMGWWSSD
ncbi:MAG: glycosyltransferase family 4 protein [Thermoanaerobaculia bacterium]